MYKFLKMCAFALLVMVTACSEEETSPKEQNMVEAVIVSPEDATVRHAYKVEVADTQEKIYHGLMGRTTLDQDSGMLFDINIAPKDSDVAFWMKDTLIPLDMIFVDENGVVFFVYPDAQPNDTTPIYTTKRPRAVLEVNAGQIESFGIKIGDVLKTDLLQNK